MRPGALAGAETRRAWVVFLTVVSGASALWR